MKTSELKGIICLPVVDISTILECDEVLLVAVSRTVDVSHPVGVEDVSSVDEVRFHTALVNLKSENPR